MRYILITLLFFSQVFALEEKTLEITKLYPSLAKDFIIYNYVKNTDLNLEDLHELKDNIFRYQGKIKALLDKRLIKDLNCSDLTSFERLRNCSNLFISPKMARKLSEKNLLQRYKKIIKFDKKLSHDFYWLKAMGSADTFKALQKKPESYIYLFYTLDTKYVKAVLNKPLNQNFLKKLAKDKRFYRLVRTVAYSNEFKKVAASLVKINPNNKNLGYESTFYLGIIATKLGKNSQAYAFFTAAIKKAQKNKHKRDKALFWAYQLSHKKALLKELSKSTDLNLYAFWAKNKLKIKSYDILTPKPENMHSDFNISDPYLWKKTKDDFEALSKKEQGKFLEKLYTQKTLAQYCFLSERHSNFSKYYFLMPHEDLLKHLKNDRKALIYALARQESRFILPSVSTSYALGMMQFMPFLANATAKELQIKDFKYFDIFKPEISLKFANHHLDFLQSNLTHPLFIAYAYNGGIGFTRRMLQNGLFKPGKYEPFLSMELVEFTESREYGKKVLVNYAIYSHLLNNDKDFLELLSSSLVAK